RSASPPRSLTGTDIREILITAFTDANERLLQLSGGSADYVSAASTCTAVLIVSNQAFIAHVGDSRAYLFRRGELVQLTSDESILPDLVTSHGGMRPTRYRQVRPLLTRALGIEAEPAAPKVTHYTLHPRDAVLFCTDGVYRALSFTDLQLALNHKEQPAEWITDRVLTLARAAGSVDNATIMFARDATEHGAPPDPSQRATPRAQSLTAAIVAVASAVLLSVSFMWTADTRLYLGSDAAGKVTLYSGSPSNILGVPMHIARTTYGLSLRQLSRVVRGELGDGITVATPAAAAALVSQWQSKVRH
ncbi:MAG TPA: protein phosphatase 2C domain-containing protein, partial [Candidatus Eremiobacteraceae bacterium]|nr:protein phosphatase 2C domain-containing protein [Candidatus Eremiobacteraceae bacterium]